MMRDRLRCACAGTVMAFAMVAVWSAWAARPLMLSEVVSADDLVAEIMAKVAETERGLVSLESFQGAADKLRRSAAQLAVFAQALAEHDEDSELKSAGPALRDAALRLAQSKTFDDARRDFLALKGALAGTSPPSELEFDWAKLARLRVLMDSMRERSDLVRKALRRPKDPVAESRHAAAMAVLVLAIDAHADGIKQSEDRPMWHTWSLDFQRSMTKTAIAIRRQDVPAASEHFAAGQEACDRCHEKFKR